MVGREEPADQVPVPSYSREKFPLQVPLQVKTMDSPLEEEKVTGGPDLEFHQVLDARHGQQGIHRSGCWCDEEDKPQGIYAVLCSSRMQSNQQEGSGRQNIKYLHDSHFRHRCSVVQRQIRGARQMVVSNRSSNMFRVIS